MTSIGKNKTRSSHSIMSQSFPDQEKYSLAWAGAGLFLLSAACLAFEVTLTHLYSLVMQYHFAFLAVSSAVLGLGIGAAVSYLRARQRPEEPTGQVRNGISQPAAIAGIAMPSAAILFSLVGFVPGIVLQAVIGALPFVAVGLATASLYMAFSSRAAWLYALDLLGAAAGLLAAQAILNQISPSSVVFVAGLVAICAALVFSGLYKNEGSTPKATRQDRPVNHSAKKGSPARRESSQPKSISSWLFDKRQRLALISLALVLVGFGLNLVTHYADLPIAAYGDAPADKTMFHVLADPAQGARLIDSAWSSFARVDLVSTTSMPQEMYAFTNAGAGSYMLRFDGDLSKLNWLKDQLEFLPFQGYTPAQTLILGAGAGKDILQALLAGSQSITAVEINPAMAEITRRYAGFNGGILDYPGVQTIVADGREFVESSSGSYDMIYLNLVYAQAPAPGSSALSESYIFTTEAFQTYWHHLAPDGRLAVIAHQGLEGSRALLTAIKALNLEGFSTQDALGHTALLMYNGDDPNQNTSVLILQKSPLSLEQTSLLGQTSQTLGMMPLFLPGTFEDLLQVLVTGSKTFDQYVAAQDYALFPTSDDQPFFFSISRGLPQPLIVLLVVAAASTIIFLVWLLFGLRKPAGGSQPTQATYPTVWQLVYFGGLGMGFMLIEVSLIQRTLLVAGNPTAAMVAVLEALLLGGGVGSMVSARWKANGLWFRLAAVAAAAAILAGGLAIWQPVLLANLEVQPESGRILLAGLILLPSGMIMGVPFANGLRLAGQHGSTVLPALWGWNAVTSVLGSALAACLAMLLGFSASLLAGAACYALVMAAALVQGTKSVN